MEFAARYQDGAVAEVRDVICIIDLASDPVMLAILDAGTREIIDRWPAELARMGAMDAAARRAIMLRRLAARSRCRRISSCFAISRQVVPCLPRARRS